MSVSLETEKSVQRTSTSTLCERSNDSPSGNDILSHLRTKFDLDTVSAVGNTLLEEYTLEMLSVRRKVPTNKPPDDRFTR